MDVCGYGSNPIATSRQYQSAIFVLGRRTNTLCGRIQLSNTSSLHLAIWIHIHIDIHNMDRYAVNTKYSRKGMTMRDQPRSDSRRLSIGDAETICITVDGQSYAARQGETVLTAIRMGVGHTRNFEFSPEKRSGFCLMGACQDCWLWRESGQRVRACTNHVEEGMKLSTIAPEII